MTFWNNLKLTVLNALIGASDFVLRLLRPRPAPPLPQPPFTIPVLLISYLPAKDGQIDIAVTGDVNGSVGAMREHVARTTEQVIAAMHEGSRYHGYKDPQAPPSLRYEIADHLEFLEPLPTVPQPGQPTPMTNYTAILERVNIRQWVEEWGVKEVWLWAYGGSVRGWESNMAGPYGDISNSDRDPTDLPRLSKTYTVFHFNYQRGTSEAMESRVHQIEAILREIDYDLFWNKFVGRPGEGRCGWAHYPPNAERDYDWANPKLVWTDIEDWTPEGHGEKKQMNCERWNCDSLTWFIFWMQNLPGLNNGITYRGRPLTNWWTFLGAFDEAMANGLKLVG